MAPPAVRMGVLGCASIAVRRMLPAMAATPEVTVVAVASSDPKRAAEVAAHFGCESVRGYEELLCREDVDALYIPQPNGLHYRWAAAALRAGKHALVEKPLATNAADVRALLALAARQSLVLRENFLFLHHGRHHRVRELLAEGAIGRPRAFSAIFGIPPRSAHDIRLRPDLDGGCLLDVGVYPIRAAQFFLEAPLRVAGAHLAVDEETGVDVSGGALLHAADGCTASLAFGFEHHYRNAYEVWGSEGRITVEWAFVPQPERPATIRVEHGGRRRVLAMSRQDQVRLAVGDFARSVRAPSAAGPGDERGSATEAALTLRQAELVDAVRTAAQS